MPDLMKWLLFEQCSGQNGKPLQTSIILHLFYVFSCLLLRNKKAKATKHQWTVEGFTFLF